MSRPIDELRTLLELTTNHIRRGDVESAIRTINNACDMLETIPQAPYCGSVEDTKLEFDENAIVCLQFECPVIFAANPHFQGVASDLLHNELKTYDIQDGSRIIFDMLCANGSTLRFFEGRYSRGYGIRDIKVLPLEEWDDCRERHAPVLAHYYNGGQVSAALLTPAQTHMLKRGRPFPLRRTTLSELT